MTLLEEEGSSSHGGGGGRDVSSSKGRPTRCSCARACVCALAVVACIVVLLAASLIALAFAGQLPLTSAQDQSLTAEDVVRGVSDVAQAWWQSAVAQPAAVGRTVVV